MMLERREDEQWMAAVAQRSGSVLAREAERTQARTCISTEDEQWLAAVAQRSGSVLAREMERTQARTLT